ncbi:hypothetical protein PR048_006666 [Dryococelus australis]|uniref:Uncharacterized protein n=1 Tax=Dryococelus australis TaxID=614101 RepID=A0ABQ9IBM1_9NEOP|nr:hypothetical protein PR048_006666 [Dryococelus australis]
MWSWNSSDRGVCFLLQCHAQCQRSIPVECTFGNLEPIYLPPHAVSIPRTEVPMEAIIGVQVRRKETMSREYPHSESAYPLLLPTFLLQSPHFLHGMAHQQEFIDTCSFVLTLPTRFLVC